MVVVYSTSGDKNCKIHLCQDNFKFTYPEGQYNSTISCVQPAPDCPPNAELTIVAYEGDSYKGEELIINNQNFGDNNFNGQTAFNFDIASFNLGSAFNNSTTQVDYTIESRLVNTQFGPAIEGLVDFVKVLKYDVCPDEATCTLSLSCEYRLQKEVNWTVGDCNPTICSGGRLELSVSPNQFVSYSWEGPNGFTRSGNSNGDILLSNCLMPEQAGEYTVTVTDANGCTASSTITIATKECPCYINATVSNETYLDNNTTNTAQHTFTYDLAIDGSGQNGWLLYDVVNGNLNQVINTGTTNTTLNMGSYPVDQNGSLIVLMDADNSACFQSIGVNMNSCLHTRACICCE